MKKLTLALLALVMLLALSGCACKHEETKLVNAADATCTEAGYTGDAVCVKCEETVTKGEEIAAMGHTAGEPRNAAASDCETEGYTGDIRCTVCNDRVEKGEAIEMLPHTPGERTGVVEVSCTNPGYTGDTSCTVCEAAIKGEVVAKLDHPYENGVCPDCGWRESGLYEDGERVYTWQELLDGGYFLLSKDNTKIFNVKIEMTGELVIDESVTVIEDDALSNGTLESIWIPATCTDLGYFFARGNENLKEAVIYAPVEWLNSSFSNCVKLEKVVLPDTLKKIDSMTFSGCESLKEIILPDSVTEVGYKAFQNCTALSGVTLSAGLKTIGSEAFYGCEALESIEVPEGTETIERYAFAECTALRTVVLPESLQVIQSYAFSGCGSLAEIELPVGLTELGDDAFEGTQVSP